MTRSAKKTAHKGTPVVIDPYLPRNGNFGYRVSRYELDLEYKVQINRLAGTATITAVALASLKTFTLDLAAPLSDGCRLKQSVDCSEELLMLLIYVGNSNR